MTPSTLFPRLVFSVLLLALTLIAPTRAAADDDTDAARAHYDKGVAAMEAGDCATAVGAFEKAMAIKPHFQIAGNLGACELELKKYRAAAEHLQWALKQLESETGRDPEKEAMGQMLDRSRLQVGSLRMVISGHGAEEATLKLDGDALAEVPELLFVVPGKHTVEASAPGAQNVSVQVTAAAGETVAVALPLKAASAQADDEQLPATGDEQDEESAAGPIVFWSTVAGAGILLGIGIGAHVVGASTQSDADALRDEILASGEDCADDCPELVGKYEDADGAYNAAVASYVLAGLFAVGAVVEGITLLGADDADEPADEQARLTPAFVITPRGDVHIGLSGQF